MRSDFDRKPCPWKFASRKYCRYLHIAPPIAEASTGCRGGRSVAAREKLGPESSIQRFKLIGLWLLRAGDAELGILERNMP
jgi:hypothetical protein